MTPAFFLHFCSVLLPLFGNAPPFSLAYFCALRFLSRCASNSNPGCANCCPSTFFPTLPMRPLSSLLGVFVFSGVHSSASSPDSPVFCPPVFLFRTAVLLLDSPLPAFATCFLRFNIAPCPLHSSRHFPFPKPLRPPPRLFSVSRNAKGHDRSPPVLAFLFPHNTGTMSEIGHHTPPPTFPCFFHLIPVRLLSRILAGFRPSASSCFSEDRIPPRLTPSLSRRRTPNSILHDTTLRP